MLSRRTTKCCHCSIRSYLSNCVAPVLCDKASSIWSACNSRGREEPCSRTLSIVGSPLLGRSAELGNSSIQSYLSDCVSRASNVCKKESFIGSHSIELQKT